jgi:hypothetical protein
MSSPLHLDGHAATGNPVINRIGQSAAGSP